MYWTLINQICLVCVIRTSFAYEAGDNESEKPTETELIQNDISSRVTCGNTPYISNTTKAEQIQTIAWWFDSVLHPTICVVGMISNLISIPVLLSHHLTNVFYRTLAFLAIFDFLFIICDLLESIRRGYPYHECDSIPYYQTIHLLLFPKFLRPLQSISMMASIYATIVVALGRYLAVSKPISTMVNNSKGSWKTVMKYVLPVISFSIIFKLPIFFEFYTKHCYKSCFDDEAERHIFNTINATKGIHLTNRIDKYISKSCFISCLTLHSIFNYRHKP